MDLAVVKLRWTTPHPSDARQTRSSGHLRRGKRSFACFILPGENVFLVLRERSLALICEHVRIADQIGIHLQAGVLKDRIALRERLDARVAVRAEQDANRHT